MLARRNDSQMKHYSAVLRRLHKSQMARHAVSAIAAVRLRTIANDGITGEPSAIPRRRAANGPAKSITNAGRHSCDARSARAPSNRPSCGASRNQPRHSGRNEAAMRGRNCVENSPWVEKPRMVTKMRAAASPATRAVDRMAGLYTARAGKHAFSRGYNGWAKGGEHLQARWPPY